MNAGRLKRVAGLSGVVVAALLAIVYGGDYLRLRFPGKRPVFGVVRVQPYLAVPQKSGKIEFMLDEPADRQCVNSLFPHFGDEPCWYLKKHLRPRINM